MTIGMNLAGISATGQEFPFLDRFKTFGGWYTYGPNGWGQPSSDVIDADGWPVSQPAGVDLVAGVPLDPGTHRWVLSYSGTATITLQGGSIVSSDNGQIVFDDSVGAVLIHVTTTDSDPIHDIHVVRQDQVDLYNSGEIFNPAFTASDNNWSLLRYMEWNQTNGSQITSWSQRTTPDQASWANVPIEVEVKLANETHTDMWVNIPAHADDDYIRQLATYVHDNLDPNLKLHLEFSNEVWNSSFEQYGYAQQQAHALWGNDDGGYVNNDVWYGYRAAQMAAIAQAAFGADASTRLSNVLGDFTGWGGPEIEDAMALGVSRAGVGSINSLFKELAVTTYFGDEFGASAANLPDQAIVLGWANSGAAGLDLAFQELEHGGLLQNNGSLDNLLPLYALRGARAQQWGLSMVAYEGGLSSYWFASNNQAEITDFFNRLLADPRMGDLYTKMVSDFAAAGGTELTAYNDIGTVSIWGPWGISPSIYDLTSPRYLALVAASGRVGGVSTAAPTYTMADSDLSLTYIGTGSFTGTGNNSANVITGGDNGNYLYGLGGNDTLVGGLGDDYLDGGTGADHMAGGPGNDIYIVDDVGDVVVELPGEGTDEVRTTLAAYTLPDNVENLTYTGTGSFTGTGNALDNVITGGDGGNHLYGGDGNDTLIGGLGDDYLDGGTGADRMVGGPGNDIYIVDDAGDVVVELPGEGTDEVRTTLAAYTLPDNVENLTYTGTGAFTGTGNVLDNVITGGDGGNHLYGGDGNDTLIGGLGDDYLDGGTGADRMVGGPGNDIYIVDNVGDVVVELPGGGTDEVRTTLATYTLPDNVENLTYTGTSDFHGTGNALANTIIGGPGNDWIDGGAGTDLMIGGAGNDTYIVDNVGDVIQELPNGGIDTVRTSLNAYTLGDNLENLVFTGTGTFAGTGNALDNVITGSATAANVLDGGTGLDTLIGGAANDIYIVRDSRDVIVEQANGGIDEVHSYANSFALSVNVENLIFVGTGNFTGTGNDSDNMIVGGIGDDHLYGGAGNDTLLGGAGNDYLDGGTGADKMIGGMGDDTYIVDNPGDLVLESPGEGYDTVISSITYTLPANVERLILAEGFTIDGSGNNLANVITGNSANNHLWGYGGDDVIDGGAGDDVIDGGDGNDTIIGGPGKDILTGGAGADTFVFRPGDLGVTLAAADQVTDFSHTEGDKLDFGAFRLTPGTPLSFIGSADFDHHAGEIRSVVSGSDFDVSIDVDGDGVADFHLLVTSRTGALVSGDFIL